MLAELSGNEVPGNPWGRELLWWITATSSLRGLGYSQSQHRLPLPPGTRYQVGPSGPLWWFRPNFTAHVHVHPHVCAHAHAHAYAHTHAHSHVCPWSVQHRGRAQQDQLSMTTSHESSTSLAQEPNPQLAGTSNGHGPRVGSAISKSDRCLSNWLIKTSWEIPPPPHAIYSGFAVLIINCHSRTFLCGHGGSFWAGRAGCI